MAADALTRSMRSRAINSANDTASRRSMHTHVVAFTSAYTGPSTCMLSEVIGRYMPMMPCPSPLVRATTPGSSMFRWLCTAPFGWPVVPLVKAMAAGANGSIEGRSTAGQSASNRAHSGASTDMDGQSPGGSSGTSSTRSSAAPLCASTCSRSGGADARLTPTQTRPARIAPRWLSARSTEFAIDAPRRSPGRSPTAWRASAHRAVATSSSA